MKQNGACQRTNFVPYVFEIRKSNIDGLGLFATANIAPGQRTLEYASEKISKAKSLRRCRDGNTFIFALDENWDLVGTSDPRFINHSCDPNCEPQLIDGRVWIVAKCAIASGEELTFNYGYDLEDYRDHPCHCGSASCVGYIVAEDFFPLLQSRAQHTRRNFADAFQ